MRCHRFVEPDRRVADLTAWFWLALAPIACGSLPIVTSKVEPAPFQALDLAFLEPGSTDLDALTEALGPAAILRKDGALRVYAVAVNQKRVVMVGGGSPYKHHYLVVELDNRDVVQRFEVIRPKPSSWAGSAGIPCTSWGICILRDPWEYHQGFLSLGHEELPADDDIAVVLDTGNTDAIFAADSPDDAECAVFIFNALNKWAWSTVEVETDDSQWRYLPERTYIRWIAPIGRHRVRAVFGPGCEPSEVQTLEFVCEPANSYFVSLAGKRCSKMVISFEPGSTASEALQNRRLVVR